MFKDRFIGMHPVKLQVNPIVKAYMISEALLWSAWNFVTPIFAVFIISNISGGNVQVASIGFSIYLLSRVIFELISGEYLGNTGDRKKLLTTVLGMLFLSVSYAGFAFADTVTELFIFYTVAGMGIGIAAPAKNSLFSMHLDKKKEATEWGVTDAVVFICMALASTVGGFIAASYGFHMLFLLACVINFLGIIPYVLTVRELKQKRKLRKKEIHFL